MNALERLKELKRKADGPSSNLIECYETANAFISAMCDLSGEMIAIWEALDWYSENHMMADALWKPLEALNERAAEVLGRPSKLDEPEPIESDRIAETDPMEGFRRAFEVVR